MQFSRIETLSSEYAICAYTGRWERIRSNPKWMRKSHSLFVRHSPWTNVHILLVSVLSVVADTSWHQKYLYHNSQKLAPYMLPCVLVCIPSSAPTGSWHLRSVFLVCQLLVVANTRWCHFCQIEDPFEQPDNAARAVGMNKLRIISNAFMDAYHKLSSGPMILNRDSLIASLTRPHISSQLGVRSHQRGSGYTGHATPEPIHYQFQNVLRLDRHRASPSTTSTVQLQGQGAFNVQGQRRWRQRRLNRDWATSELGWSFGSYLMRPPCMIQA